MGDAKRRKQRDVSYGQIYQIRTTEDFQRHLDKLFKNFYLKWEEAMHATNNNLDEVNQRLADRMQEQFSCYKVSDRQLFATALLRMYIEAGTDYLDTLFKPDKLEDQAMVLKMFIECLIKVLKPWLSEDQQREIDEFFAERQG
jgi:hypothetical protein